MKRVLNRDFEIFSSQLDGFIRDFSNSGIQFGKANRNSIKLFQLNNQTINIKSFKIPNIFNQIAYKFLRKSKAQRSFEYACKLQNLGELLSLLHIMNLQRFFFLNEAFMSVSIWSVI
jgi:hypothetical protein